MPPTKINGYQILAGSITGTQLATGTITPDKLSFSDFPTIAAALKTTGANVIVSSAISPTTGQVLTATSPIEAHWADVAGTPIGLTNTVSFFGPPARRDDTTASLT